jgi:hypothetical protein
MKLTISRAMLEALEHATDKPDWLSQRLASLAAGPEPYVLSLGTQESTALEELCAMNIRFDAAGKVLDRHQALDDLATMIMQNY